jgi:hypothetical protein
MPDIGLNPVASGNIHSFTGVATAAGIELGHAVVSAGTGDHTDVTDQMGPTGSVITSVGTIQATSSSTAVRVLRSVALVTL